MCSVLFRNIEYYYISREKFEPKPGLELEPPDLEPGALPVPVQVQIFLLKFNKVNVQRHKL